MVKPSSPIGEAQRFLKYRHLDTALLADCDYSYVSLLARGRRGMTGRKARAVVRVLGEGLATRMGSIFTPAATVGGDLEQLKVLLHQLQAQKFAEATGA